MFRQKVNGDWNPVKDLATSEDLASVVSLADLKEVLTDSQIAKLQSNVERRLMEIKKSEDMIQNDVIEHMGGV